jgi:hypothetical protein
MWSPLWLRQNGSWVTNDLPTYLDPNRSHVRLVGAVHTLQQDYRPSPNVLSPAAWILIS